MKSAALRFITFVAVALSVMLGNVIVQGQEVYSEEDLKAMSADELELICIMRGFEILKDEIDPSTGLPYELSHDDFVEAARRCLEIEQEMNELLAEHPELAEELQEELKKMEEEQKERLAEVEELKQKLSESEAKMASSEEATSDSPAFVGSAGASVVNDIEVTDDGDMEPEEVSSDASTIMEGGVETVTKSANSDIAVEEEGQVAATNTTEDFTLKAIGLEMVRAMIKQAENDIRRIVELAIPVLQPLLRAGDKAWKRMRVAFEKLRSVYQANRDQKNNAIPEEK